MKGAIGLLIPTEISDAGYRLYGTGALERLQQILLYRELDFTLEQISGLLRDNPDRSAILAEQEELLHQRKERLERIIETLRKTQNSRERGEQMEDKELFKGFEREEEWKEALREQHEYLKETYDYDLLNSASVQPQRMNELALEGAAFMTAMAEALRTGRKHSDGTVTALISSHLEFLAGHGHSLSPQDFAAQNQFFLGDDFHLRMLEGQQTGLAYYLAAAADAYAAGAESESESESES
ncbi:hypothetical protein KC345_g10814 [Hortaea werneckii]|nr:hypothetical protein KC345_g10814 [Hortaea werneckii]